MNAECNNVYTIHAQEEAISYLPLPDSSKKTVTIIGTERIRNGFEQACLQQAINAASAPGVTDFVLNPDGHAGYGAPIGSVLVSPSHIYPGPVGVDIKCSMSLLQLDLPAEEIADRRIRRALINAICERTPTGAGKGQRSVRKARQISLAHGKKAIIEGASPEVCEALGLPWEWTKRCEDAFHLGHDGTKDALELRLNDLLKADYFKNFEEKVSQLGSYGSGNHFGECNTVHIKQTERAKTIAQAFGLVEGQVAFLSHCGSRGFGNILAQRQFKLLGQKFKSEGTPFPGGDWDLVYAPLGTEEANNYLDDLALGGNFATVNHLLINALVLEAFQEVLPGTEGGLIYFISHNIARKEVYKDRACWVHRKGATRAFPAGHPELKGTDFEKTGHPILLPGNPKAGSVVMVAEPGAERSCYSVNHGAGRAMGRKAAMRVLDQFSVDSELEAEDILTNCRQYPLDEAPAAYKDFAEVLRSVELAGLASTVATLKARFVIKDSDES